MLIAVLSMHPNNSGEGPSNNYQQELRLRHCKAELYKTELCKNWQKYHSCDYGEKCKFAHGPHEQRFKLVHPKYKTEPCENYANGYCQYGTRCRFIH